MTSPARLCRPCRQAAEGLLPGGPGHRGAGDSVGDGAQQSSDRRVGDPMQERAVQAGSQPAQRRPVDAGECQPCCLLAGRGEREVAVQDREQAAGGPVASERSVNLMACQTRGEGHM